MDVAPAAQRWAGRGLLWASVALLVGAVFFGGGSGESSVPWLGSLAVLAAGATVAAAALGLVALPGLGRYGSVAGAAGAGLLAWGGLSIWWSIAGDRSWDALNKGLVYASFALVGAALGARPGCLRLLGIVVSAVLGAALVWGLAGKAIPALFPDGDRATRLRNPVGYWNGLALLADTALPLGLWLATALRARAARVAGASLVYVALLSLLLTQSRAGMVAGAVVVALWLRLATKRAEGALLLVLAGAPAVAVGAWAFTRPALVEDAVARSDRVGDGWLFALFGAVGLALAVALVLLLPVERIVRERGPAVARALLLGAAGLVAVGLVALVAAVGNPVSWASGQFTDGECANDPSRLTTLCANNRTAWWGEAIDVFQAHVVAGSGARTFEIARKRYRDDATSVSEPHSVPLQLLADTGLVGLALGLAFAVALGAALVSALRRSAGGERAAASALVALPVAFALHSLVDYDLDFIALAGPTTLVSFALVAAGRPHLAVPRGLFPALAPFVVALAAVVSLASPWLAGREVDESTAALDAGLEREAVAAADQARSLNPLGLDPVFARARAAELAGDNEQARALYLKAVAMQPENPEPWGELGLFELYGSDDACAGYVALNSAYTLDPKGRQWVPGGPLDQAREEVNNGACER